MSWRVALLVGLAACKSDPLIGIWTLDAVTDSNWEYGTRIVVPCQVSEIEHQFTEAQGYRYTQVDSEAEGVERCDRVPETVTTTTYTGEWTRFTMGREEIEYLVARIERSVVETTVAGEVTSEVVDGTTNEAWWLVELGKDEDGPWLWLHGSGFLRKKAEK